MSTLLTVTEENLLAAVIHLRAGKCSNTAKLALACMIRNRVQINRPTQFGLGYQEVCGRMLMNPDLSGVVIGPDDEAAAHEVYSNPQSPDLSNSALYFHRADEDPFPEWTLKARCTVRIGALIFYSTLKAGQSIKHLAEDA